MTISTSKKMFSFRERELRKALRDTLTRAAWLGPGNFLIGSFWACACKLSWTLLSPARVQPLYGAGRKESSGTGLGVTLKTSNIADLRGAYHLARKSGNFGLKSNGKVIFRKFCSEIVEYLQRYSSFSVRNGTAEISLPFARLCSFQSLISRKQLREIEVQMVSVI